MRIRDALFGWKIEKGPKTARRTGPFWCTWFRMVVYFWLNLNLSRSAKICLENKIRIWNPQGCAAAAAPCPRPPAFIFGWQLKIYLVVRPGDLLFEISLWDKNSLTVICLFVFDFLCCIEVCNLKWLNWEYLRVCPWVHQAGLLHAISPISMKLSQYKGSTLKPRKTNWFRFWIFQGGGRSPPLVLLDFSQENCLNIGKMWEALKTTVFNLLLPSLAYILAYILWTQELGDSLFDQPLGNQWT